MKMVNILERDVEHRVVRASVRDVRSPVAVVAQKLADEGWEPLYGLDTCGERISLPHCFSLNDDCLAALNDAANAPV
jgi:hypothetical protein